MLARDALLAAETSAQLHIAHVSSRGSVEIVRWAKARGFNLTAEATPHHLALCDEDIPGDNADFKMSPPLRARADVEALVGGIADGTIDIIASDHAPHTRESKQRRSKDGSEL